MTLHYDERRADGTAHGLLVLHHGRGSDERDLLGLADVLDPEQRLHVVAPRAPMHIPGSPGYHWYLVPRVGFPDHDSFHAAHNALAQLHDELWQRTGVTPAQTVLGGFSMGSVMTYALGLDGARPSVAGLLPFAGFIPTVDDWAPDFAAHTDTRVLLSHGRADGIMSVDFARQADAQLRAGGMTTEYQESDVGHSLDSKHLQRAVAWLGEVLPERD